MAKKDDQTPDLAAENAALKEQIDAQAVQQNQFLDYLAELKDELAAVKAQQTTAPVAKEDPANQVKAELDAEWEKLHEEFKDLPNIDIMEQRVLVGTDADEDIRLHDEPGLLVDPKGTNRKWKLRWFNLAVDGRAQKATNEGYTKVRWEELQDAESIAALERRDEFVRIGDKGSEVLYKTPLKYFTYKKKRDAARTQGLLTSESQLRDHLAGNVARMAGNVGDNADQAGSLIHNTGNFSVSITKGQKETVTF